MMVHKFTVECGGERVAWAKVAASAKALGVVLPEKLPPGYAPVSRLKGRFVLPGFGKTTMLPSVTSEKLSRDAVIEAPAQKVEPESAAWVTVVDPVAAPPAATGNAFKVAGVISTLLVSLLLACIVLVRRRQLMAFEFSFGAGNAVPAGARFWEFAAAPFSLFQRRFESWRPGSSAADDDDDGSEMLAPIRTRLHETEFLVSMLPADLLLRDVLTSELDSLHDRLVDLGRREAQLGVERVNSAIRTIVRDLDRVSRIAQGAMPASAEMRASAAPEPDVPSTVFEAYRILGLNPDAPDAAVKKIVDALRMSWHPDHAKNEADRRYREQRIKQVNAAWDLLKVKRAAAA
ncbi:DnaJ domain-containing protein [Hyphomicrobium sp. B1]|uniref:J domain-containing protein n=1 Tax=Hyphomicrobium sp. B1 TaxID=3075651 RepID=UPI003C2CCC70